MKKIVLLVVSCISYQTVMPMMPHLIKSLSTKNLYTQLPRENKVYVPEEQVKGSNENDTHNGLEPFISSGPRYDHTDPRWNDPMLFYKLCSQKNQENQR
jgi:hypothetical protein